MRRRDLFAALFTPQADEFGLRLYHAYSDLQELVKAYFGCEADAPMLNDEYCKSYRSKTDYKLLEKSRKSSARLHGFKE